MPSERGLRRPELVELPLAPDAAGVPAPPDAAVAPPARESPNEPAPLAVPLADAFPADAPNNPEAPAFALAGDGIGRPFGAVAGGLLAAAVCPATPAIAFSAPGVRFAPAAAAPPA